MLEAVQSKCSMLRGHRGSANSTHAIGPGPRAQRQQPCFLDNDVSTHMALLLGVPSLEALAHSVPTVYHEQPGNVGHRPALTVCKCAEKKVLYKKPLPSKTLKVAVPAWVVTGQALHWKLERARKAWQMKPLK